MAALIDTNIVVDRFDPRFPAKQRIATALLRAGIAADSICLPHQAIVEFVAAVTRRAGGSAPLLDPADAARKAEELLTQFEVLVPDADLVRIALRGAAAFRLSWVGVPRWADAERFGCRELWSEDFQHRRLNGTVEAVNPFVAR